MKSPRKEGKRKRGKGRQLLGVFVPKGKWGFFGKSVDAAGMGALALENAQIWDLLVLVLLWSFAVTSGFFSLGWVMEAFQGSGFSGENPVPSAPLWHLPWECRDTKPLIPMGRAGLGCAVGFPVIHEFIQPTPIRVPPFRRTRQGWAVPWDFPLSMSFSIRHPGLMLVPIRQGPGEGTGAGADPKCSRSRT